MAIISPVTFIKKLIRNSELGKPFRLMPFQEEILRLAFAFDGNGKLPYDTILYSTIKKSGKSALGAIVSLYWALVEEAPNEILLLANDLEQSLSRVFRSIEGLIQYNPELRQECEVQSKVIYCSNGSVIKALSCDYESESGSNHGLTSWDELWAYNSESSRRLFEELTPVPTRKNSIRFITTYSGFSNESQLLWDLYKQSVGRDEHPDGQGERIHPTLPVYRNREARIFAYWDHEPRMPWQTKEYYESQKKTLRHNTYLRLHENRWTTGEESFVSAELWDSAVEPGLRQDPTGSLFIGVDAAIKHDCAAIVAVKYGEHDSRLILADHKIIKPGVEGINLESTVEF